MSNYVSSTITVNRTTYNNMQRDAQTAAALRSDLARANQANAALTAQVNAANARIAAAKQEFNNVWDAINAANDASAAMDANLRAEITNIYNESNNRIQALANTTQRNLQELRTDFGNAIKDSIEANNRVIESAMNRSNQQLTGMINGLRADTNAAIAAVNANLTNLTQGAASLLDSALEYMTQIGLLQNRIADTRHALLLPGKYDSLLNCINLAQSNINLAQNNPMNSSVARDKARAAFEEAVRFLEEIAIAEQEWQAQLSVAEQISALVAEQLESSRTIEPKPGRELDVNYWANNGIDRNKEDYQKLADILKKPDNLTAEQLIDLQQALVEVSRRIDETVADAYVRIATSQRAVKIAEQIHRALNEKGDLRVIAHAYEGNDKRGNYRFISRNELTGLTVVITVSVAETNGELRITPEADIVGYGNMSPAAAEAMVRGIMEDISGGNARCTQTPANAVLHPERENIDEWKHPRTGSAHTHTNPGTGTNNPGSRNNTANSNQTAATK